MSPAQNTLDAFLKRASSSTKPRERGDVENVENVDPERAHDDDARARAEDVANDVLGRWSRCLLYTSPSPRDLSTSRMPSSA